METRAMVFLGVVVGLFGVMSAVLGFMAESKKLTPADIHVVGTECVYPANPAYSLAVGAILLLVASQIIASVAGSCCGCCRPAGAGASKKTKRQVAGIVVSVLSWIMAVIAGVYYCIGASWNAPERRTVTVAGRNEECLYLKDGVFVRAGVLTLVATALAIKSFILLREPPVASTAEPVAGAAEFKPDGQNPSESGVAIGLPQWPAQGYGQARV